MITSPAGLALIKEFEGCRLEAYQDQVGVWTIGYGSTRGVRPGDRTTPAEAEVRLRDDLQRAEAAIRRLVTVPIGQNQFDALTSFVFNLGATALAKSTLLRLLNQKKFEAAAEEFGRWNFAGGVRNAGLVRRREAERCLFLGIVRHQTSA